MIIAYIEHAFQDLTSIEMFKNQGLPSTYLFKSHLFASENNAFSAAASDCALADGCERKDPFFRAVMVRGEAISYPYAFASAYTTAVVI